MTDLDFLSISISCDEDSPFYQCEVTLKSAQDYVRFTRDTPFIIHLLNIDYYFIVDSRRLDRTIDDSGNYIETCSLSGLSPLAQKASPRGTKITKTWDTALSASTIVEELIGPVTWNLVDWIIPAYRLSADNASPLDVALQIVNAAGGLIESNPDGSVVCRHRWPVSIANFETASFDLELTETSIFSINETSIQDELVDKFRIYDTDPGFQDRLEYIPNKIGEEDDPNNGILYVFPSPWREGLRVVTTRPTAVIVGTMTEGTRSISSSNEDYPPEIVTFTDRTGSVQYPIMSLTSSVWLDEDLGSVIVTPYSTTIEAGNGLYGGYSIARVEYVTRYLSVPVQCVASLTDPVEAQFLLLETQNG